MKRLIKYVLNTAIVMYLGVIYFSGVPASNTLNNRLRDNARTIAFAVGIWPSWSMFAPNPIKYDARSFVEITYKNGEVKEYDVEKKVTGIFSTFRKARWMKYSQDNLTSPDQKKLLKPAIRYFANKYEIEGNPITKLKLKKKWAVVHPFSNDSLHSIHNTPRKEKLKVLITQKVER